jgi:hypothetical protein
LLAHGAAADEADPEPVGLVARLLLLLLASKLDELGQRFNARQK